MRILLSVAFATAVVGFSPGHSTSRARTAQSMSVVDDWKNFFSKEENQRRQEKHDVDMAEMREAQKEILDRRRDPQKMDTYHNLEVKRHEMFDHQHDVDIENELAKEWTADAPFTRPFEKRGHSILDDWKKFFSKEEMDHRRVQHHLGLLDTAVAEEQMLQHRRDPAKMREDHMKDVKRHQHLDKQHEIEVGLEFSEEKVLREGDGFMNNLVKNLFGKKQKA